MTAFNSNLIAVCEKEWEFFGRSMIRLNGTTTVGLREYDDGAWQRIGDYWKHIGGAYQHLTGKDRGTPWSAAFISWCMAEAGAGNRFPYSPGHATYINAAIKNAKSGAANASLIGHRPGDYTLKVGDLIGYWRGPKKITFDNALSVGWYQSHTDIVVEIKNGVAYSIGGNVMHSVTRREVRINDQGKLVDKRENWFVVVEQKIVVP